MDAMSLEWWAGVLGGIGPCLIVWWVADRARRWSPQPHCLTTTRPWPAGHS